MAIGSGTNPNFNIQSAANNQSLVYDSSQNAFINANISVTGTVTGGLNAGTGSKVFKSLVGTDLNFRSLVAGTGVSLTENANDITLSATGTVSTAGNLGTGKGIFAQIATGNLQLRSLTVGTGLTTSNTATEINIAVDSANLNAGTLGGNAASVFLTKADNLASVGSIATARTNLDVFSKAESQAAYYRKDSDLIPTADNTKALGSNSYRFSDIYAVEFHGLSTSAGVTNSIANHSLGGLANVDETGKTSGQLLKYNGTKWVPGTVTSDSMLEGSTNLYYTDARVDARAQLKIDALIGGAPGALDTLNELAAAINDNASYAATMTTSLAGKEPVITAGATSQYWRGDKSWQTLNTTAVAEGSNLYFTNARFDTRLGTKSTTNLAEGTNLYFTNARADARIAAADTGDLSEGSNLYYTDARFDTRFGSRTTDNLTEGTTNLYFSNARADARIAAASINALSDVDTTGIANSKILKYSSASSKWVMADDTGGGSGADNFLALTDTPANFSGAASRFVKVNAAGNALEFTSVSVPSVLWDLTNVHNQAPTNGQVLTYNTAQSRWEPSNAGSGDITDVIAGTGLTGGAASGAATLNVDVGTGANKIVQLDGTGKLPAIDGSQLTGVSTTTTLAGLTDTTISGPSNGQVLKYNGTKWVNGADAGGIALTDLSITTAAAGSAALSYNNGTGVFTFTPPDLSSYLTSVPAQSFASLTGKPTTIAGYGITDALALGTSATTALAGNTTFSFASLTGKPTTIAGYGITDAYDNTDFDTRLATKTTANLTEGANLYFTNARADARADARITNAVLSALSNVHTAAPTDGQVLKWDNGNSRWAPASDSTYTSFNTDFDNRLATKSTTNLAEGTNLYYTQARADARVDAGFTAKSTSDLSEGSNLYYTNARADARITNAMVDEDNMASDSNTKVPTQQSVKAYVDSQVASENELSEMNDVTISGVANNQFLKYNSTSSKWENTTAGTSTAGGADTQVQFNDGGTINGDAGLTYNKATNTLTATTFVGNLTGQASSIANHILDEDNFATDSATKVPSQQSVKAYIASQIATKDNTDEIAEGSTNLYYTDARANSAFDTRLATKSTTNLSEGTNLYFTNARVGTYLDGTLNVDIIPSTHTTYDLGNTTKRFKDAYIQGTVTIGTGTIASTQISNWNTAYGWGDHGAAGYLSSISANSINDTHIDWGTGANQVSTADIPENTNLYYTDARADARADARITNALIDEDNMASNSATKLPSQQSVKAYVDARILTVDNTDEMSEGSTNLYFTNARADARIAAATFTTLSDVTAVGASDNNKILYYEHASTSFKWKVDAGGPANTDALTEGSSNLYFTNARADARITAALIDEDNMATNSATRLPSQQSVKAYVDAQAHYSSFNADFDTRIATKSINVLTDVNTSGAASGKILKHNGSAWVVADDSGGIALTDLSVTTAAASGGGTLSYNNGSGVFTFAPADLTSYLTSTGALSSHTDVHTVAATDGQVLTWDNGNSRWAAANASGGNAFKTLAVSGQSDVVADASDDTLTLVAGTGIVLTTNAGSDTVTIASSASGGTDYEEFKINYATNGQLSTITNKTSGISGVSIDSAAGGDLTVTFTGYTTPPLTFSMYGYNYAANEYNFSTVGSGSMTLKKVPGGGTSGSPTAFGSFATMKIRCAEAETGASRSFGTTTHAWVRFVMGA